MTELQPAESSPMTFEIEGLDDSGLDYPLDYVLIRNEARTIYDVLRRINSGQYIMDPDFQRVFIWDERKQSKLIESVIKRIPLPAFYFAENRDGKMIVVDGLQRLGTFKRFVDEGSRLQLENDPELNGKRFADLSARLQNQFEDFNLIVHVIDWRTPDRVKFDIFGRVNSGVPLNRQQMRNALYNGKGTQFLREEVDTGLFKKAMYGRGTLNEMAPESVNRRWVNNMNDRHLINRFCAFDLLGFRKYQGDMDEFLNQALVHMNGMEDGEIERLRTRFRTGLSNNYSVFGINAFRVTTRSGRVYPFNAPLWDVMVTGLAGRDPDLVNSRRDALHRGFAGLMDDLLSPRYPDALSSNSNLKGNVINRFRKSREMFRRAFGD